MSDSELHYNQPEPPTSPSPPPPAPPNGAQAPSTGRTQPGHPRTPAADRPAHPPHRSSTLSTPHDFDRKRSHPDFLPHARSEDLNHSAGRRERGLERSNASAAPHSRPTSPQPAFAADASKRLSATSTASVAMSRSGSSDATAVGSAISGASSTSTAAAATTCSACGKTMQGAFVRALGTVFHLNCFMCLDCGTVVAQKFFPIDGPDGRQYPLCERDYFRRLNLICAKCGTALRGSYITACNKKFHVEHFTCLLCPTLFGPQDSYYEHDGDVYCHYHYSTRFATKCAGCGSAILKQFVEINRNNRDECWHPECYMINKFWNVKLVSRRSMTPPLPDANGQSEPPYADEERRETPTSLRDKQIRMEQQVYRIWTVLSAFEESSAACISDMLRHVSNGQYLEAIRMAEKFILHVEVLFATIDDLEFCFSRLNLKGMSHVREARMLCRKTVDLFTLLSHTQETGVRRMGMTQELLALVTGLAHYLKILIRIALTGALKLEREQGVREAITGFLDKLHLLAVQGGNPGARRILRQANGEPAYSAQDEAEGATQRELSDGQETVNIGTQGVTYGFRSLCPEKAGESPFWDSAREREQNAKAATPPSDLCVKCAQTVEEDCVRLGTYQRWHSHCVACKTCGRASAALVAKDKDRDRDRDKDKGPDGDRDRERDGPKLSSARRPPANVGMFVYDEASRAETPTFGVVPTVIYCTDHAHSGCRGGFQPVSRLEQYAFLLNVALRRLYILLKKRGVVPLSPVAASAPMPPQDQDPYRNSVDILRMKSVHLDRKISATARLPKRSTIVESPAGKSVHPTDVMLGQRSQETAGQTSYRGAPSSQSNNRVPGPSGRPQQQQSGPPARPPYPGPLDTNNLSAHGQVIRPSFARNNTEVMIVDESMPSSPAQGPDEQASSTLVSDDAGEDGITLADIPQLMEAAQAREQHRSLPRQSSAPFIAELTALELVIVKHAALLILDRSSLKNQFDLDELLDLVELKKGGFWNKLFKSGNDKKNVKKKGVFGVPLELLVEREGADSLLGASRTTLRVPSFIDDVVSAMRQMDMSIEGIFRKNGNIRRLNELTEAIDRDPSSVDLSQDNPVQLAALLKKFLRELPDPLMTYKLHRLLIATQSLPNERDRKRLLHMVSLLLPKYHRDTMEVLFVFLKWVASFAHMDEETGSKMDLGNLATVICPSILKARSKDAARDESFGAIRVITALLENQDEFYVVPEEFLPILHDQEYFASSVDLPSKEFLKKCELYMRLKASGRNPALMSPTIPPSFGSSTSGNLSAISRTVDGQDGRPLPRHMQSGPAYGDRPSLGTPTASESHVRNIQPHRRQQSPQPPPLAHSPMSYPTPGNGSPIGASPGLDSMLAAQNDGWASPRMPSQQPPSRPSSAYGSSRPSEEHQHPFHGNGHPVQLRQRT